MAGAEAGEQDVRKTEAFALASGAFQATAYVSQFIRSSVRAWIDLTQITDDAGAVLMAQFLRVDSWLRTLAKLNEPADFQGVASACRALLEATIDIVLLSADPEQHTTIRVWENSAKLKHAECLTTYLNQTGAPVEPAHEPLVAFVTSHKEAVDAQRSRRGWMRRDKPKHPDRWTNRSLAEDAKHADRVGSSFKFEEFYETEYRKLCWLVHGSALVVRGIPAEDFPGIAGLLFPHCADLGLIGAELTLRYLKLWTPEREAHFARVNMHRALILVETMRASLGQQSLPL